MSSNFPDRLQGLLQKKSEIDGYRHLLKADGIDFFSNDYVGAARIPHDSNLSAGSTGSRLISGNASATEEAENILANFFGFEAGLIFNSGYDANIGVMSSILQRGDTVLYDSLCHASIRDGIRLSNAKAFSFDHNSIDSLAAKFERAEGNVYVVVESIYSMDGDLAPLVELAKFCTEKGAYLIVDEAHAGGVTANLGRGYVNAQGLMDQTFATILTYGKGFGSHGAIVLGSKELREYLINFARSFIYTTALSPIAVQRMVDVTAVVAKMNDERLKLRENIIYFRMRGEEAGLSLMDSASHIQGINVGGNKATNELSEKIRSAGYMVKSILSPTVPEGKERIRICIHSFNTHDEIDGLIQAIGNE